MVGADAAHRKLRRAARRCDLVRDRRRDPRRSPAVADRRRRARRRDGRRRRDRRAPDRTVAALASPAARTRIPRRNAWDCERVTSRTRRCSPRRSAAVRREDRLVRDGRQPRVPPLYEPGLNDVVHHFYQCWDLQTGYHLGFQAGMQVHFPLYLRNVSTSKFMASHHVQVPLEVDTAPTSSSNKSFDIQGYGVISDYIKLVKNGSCSTVLDVLPKGSLSAAAEVGLTGLESSSSAPLPGSGQTLKSTDVPTKKGQLSAAVGPYQASLVATVQAHATVDGGEILASAFITNSEPDELTMKFRLERRPGSELDDGPPGQSDDRCGAGRRCDLRFQPTERRSVRPDQRLYGDLGDRIRPAAERQRRPVRVRPHDRADSVHRRSRRRLR